MLILASGSPRRRELLDLLGVRFQVEPVEIDESVLPAETPEEAVLRLAIAKGSAACELHPDRWVLSADTVVAMDDRILGKPLDRIDAMRMLRRLSGTEHRVHTGIALSRSGGLPSAVHSETVVHFRDLDPVEIEAYVATGEPSDKAGAYAVQGLGGTLVDRVDGELSTVVGLTLSTTARLLSSVGIPHALRDPNGS